MSHSDIASTVGALVGLVIAAGARRRTARIVGGMIVCAAIAAILVTQPSSSRHSKQPRVEDVCHNVRRHLELFRHHQEDEAFRAQFPWSEQAQVWLGVAELARTVEPLCVTSPDSACLPDLDAAPKTYQDIKPDLDRIIHAFETRTGCGARPPGAGS
jgi:hypothetical protein